MEHNLAFVNCIKIFVLNKDYYLCNNIYKIYLKYNFIITIINDNKKVLM